MNDRESPPEKASHEKPENQAAREAANKPTRDDVHEQREPARQQGRRPTQSQIELDRAAGEGMTAPPSDPRL